MSTNDLEFGVGCVRSARFVVAEQLPCRDLLQIQLGFELCEVGQRGAFPKHASKELGAGLLHADFECGMRV